MSIAVMSQLELRILTSLAEYNKRVLKNFDIKQAFVQSNLFLLILLWVVLVLVLVPIGD
jgi:hypothetical protein